jgi:hypothetical protein
VAGSYYGAADMTRLRPALLALALLAGGACSSKGGPDAAPTASASLAPVPAPAGLLADVFVTTPGATWTKARQAVGGPAVFMPQSFGGLVTTLIGMPITQAAELDEAVPAVGAFARQGKGPLAFTVAVHVKDGDRFLTQLTKGEGARYEATLDVPSHVTLLVDKIAAKTGSARTALGVLGNYLLVAEKPADLIALGPYVVRTLPARPPPKEEVVMELSDASLAGPVAEALRDLREDGESAAALVSVGGMLDTLGTLLGSASRARITVSLDAQVVRARANVVPKPGGAGEKLVAELPVGDAKPLLDLPEGTTLGLLWRESAASRAESAPKQADSLAKLLGKDVSGEDREAIRAALRAEAEARGDWQTVGITFAGTGPTAVVRAPVGDAEKMKKALKQLTDLGALPTFKKSLAGVGLRIDVEKAVVENLAGDVVRVRLARVDSTGPHAAPNPGADAKAKPDKGKKDDKAKPASDGDLPKSIDLLYLVNGQGLFAAAGFDPKDSLKNLALAGGGANLAHNKPMADALAGLGDAGFVLIADALRVEAMTAGMPAAGPPLPLVLAAGRTAAPAELWGRLDLPVPVLQRLVTEMSRRRTQQPIPAAPR